MFIRLALSACVLTLGACAPDPSDTADTATSAAPDPAPPTSTPTTPPQAPDALAAAIAGDWRDSDNVARDQYRNPQQTLAFFGVQPTQTVVEITPGGGWYAEILAPYLRDGGQYIAAISDPTAMQTDGGREYQERAKSRLETLFDASPAQYDQAQVVAFDPAAPSFGAPGSADVVVTFRNVHNWRGNDQAAGMFEGFHDVLKPGGTLGVVEHRAKGDLPADDESGYVGEQQVIALAEDAGFELDEKSEINANPKDTTRHPNGVWTLPPGNSHDDADAEKYRAIGESDRMTLRFRKPVQ